MRYPGGHVQRPGRRAHHLPHDRPADLLQQGRRVGDPHGDLRNSEEIPVVPYYEILALPGETEPEFALLLPFAPLSKKNMASLLVARQDGDNYGKLLIIDFPKDKLVFGPAQIEARISNEPVISSQLTLWNQAGQQGHPRQPAGGPDRAIGDVLRAALPAGSAEPHPRADPGDRRPTATRWSWSPRWPTRSSRSSASGVGPGSTTTAGGRPRPPTGGTTTTTAQQHDHHGAARHDHHSRAPATPLAARTRRRYRPGQPALRARRIEAQQAGRLGASTARRSMSWARSLEALPSGADG